MLYNTYFVKTNNLMWIWLFFSLASCSKSSNGGSAPAAVVPAAGVGDVTQERANTSSKYRFFVDLNGNPTQAVKVDYTTVAGTAKENTDYVPVSGTLTIPAGSTEGYVDVMVTGDSLRQAQQLFYLQLSAPLNCTLGVSKATGTILNDGTYLPTDSSVQHDAILLSRLYPCLGR